MAEAYNADNSTYPAITANFTAGTTAKLPTSIVMQKGGGTAGTTYASASASAAATTGLTSALGQTNVAFLITGSATVATGGVILYWDFTGAGAVSTNYVYFGAANASSTFYAPAS